MKRLAKLSGAIIVLLSVLIVSLWSIDIPVEQLKEKYANEESQFMEVRGMQVHYRDEGAGFPLVLIHGTAASLHTWDDWTKILKSDFRIIRMDLPAFGLTGPSADRDYSIESYVLFINKFLSKLSIDTFYMAGNSLGGQIAWNYAVKYPEEVKKMILIDAAGYPKEAPQIIRLARNPVFASIFKHCTPKFLIKKNMQEVYGDDSKISDELVTRYHQMSLRKGNRQAFIDRVGKKGKSNIKMVKGINCPVLIQWGDQDIWIPLEHARNFHKDIPNSELVIYKGAGHVPMEEIPQETARDVQAFLLN